MKFFIGIILVFAIFSSFSSADDGSEHLPAMRAGHSGLKQKCEGALPGTARYYRCNCKRIRKMKPKHRSSQEQDVFEECERVISGKVKAIELKRKKRCETVQNKNDAEDWEIEWFNKNC